jgi:patatin-like phospholipase/acyl hydrolase
MAGVPDGNPKDDGKDTRRILCLSGGGYRGLFTAVVLEHIESQLQRTGKERLRDHFDLVAGTSIGGLLACGVAAGIAARRLRETRANLLRKTAHQSSQSGRLPRPASCWVPCIPENR